MSDHSPLNKNLPKEVQQLSRIANLSQPPEWHTLARQMSRVIHLHLGPTNSGKTYGALKRLREAKSGVYLGPLRLLAHEVYERMNKEWNVPCRLITGEERREPSLPLQQDAAPQIEFLKQIITPEDAIYKKLIANDASLARHTSSTIEMADLNRVVDVAVIDEIQMIADPMRGWAWTQALLGIPAREIHLCGEVRTLPILKALIEQFSELSGDRVVIHDGYKRLTPLTVEKRGLGGSFETLEKGDVVVAFSRATLFWLKQQIERSTKLRCAIIYGSLPPETRSEQARLFNDPESGYDILLASDAVGMGLNLAVRRVIFYEMKKFDGNSKTLLTVSQTKQIAGRAGRFAIFTHSSRKGKDTNESSSYTKSSKRDEKPKDKGGLVTSFMNQDMPTLRKLMAVDANPIQIAGLHPTFEIIQLFSHYLSASLKEPNPSLHTILEYFECMAQLDSQYFLCDFDTLKAIAKKVESIEGISLQNQWTLCSSPVRYKNPQEFEFFGELASGMAYISPLSLDNEPVSLFGLNSLREMFATVPDFSKRGEAKWMGALKNLQQTIKDGPPSISSWSHKLLEQEESAQRDDDDTAVTQDWKAILPHLDTSTRARSNTADILAHYESMHRMMGLYLWLHYRFPAIYASGRLAWATKTHLERVMETLLERDGSGRRMKQFERRRSIDDEAVVSETELDGQWDSIISSLSQRALEKDKKDQ